MSFLLTMVANDIRFYVTHEGTYSHNRALAKTYETRLEAQRDLYDLRHSLDRQFWQKTIVKEA